MTRIRSGVSWLRTALAAAAAAVCLTACAGAPEHEPPPADPLAPQKDRVLQPFDEQARRGLARERAVYPHHFRPDSAELTDLGRTTLAAIVQQLPADGARIHVSPGTGAGDLAERRVQAVVGQLQALGLPSARVTVAVGQPGGQGAATVDVLAARADEPLTLPPPITQPSGGRQQ